jgi:hypothetical protein
MLIHERQPARYKTLFGEPLLHQNANLLFQRADARVAISIIVLPIASIDTNSPLDRVVTWCTLPCKSSFHVVSMCVYVLSEACISCIRVNSLTTATALTESYVFGRGMQSARQSV